MLARLRVFRLPYALYLYNIHLKAVDPLKVKKQKPQGVGKGRTKYATRAVINGTYRDGDEKGHRCTAMKMPTGLALQWKRLRWGRRRDVDGRGGR